MNEAQLNTKNRISNNQDYIDSRDIEERIKELGKLKAKTVKEFGVIEWHKMEESIERASLVSLKKQYIDDYDEKSWGYGATFIKASYFENYTEEYTQDTYEIPTFLQYHIDWRSAAEELSMDYTKVKFNGVDYYTREA